MNPLSRALRDADPDVLALLRDALVQCGGDLQGCALALGFAGRSTLYRIAASSDPGAAPVREIIAAHGRKAGRPTHA